MTIPIAVIFYIYLAVIVIVAIFSFFNIYHLFRFAPGSFKTYTIIILYLMAVTLTILTTFAFLGPVDWSQSIDLSPSVNQNILQ